MKSSNIREEKIAILRGREGGEGGREGGREGEREGGMEGGREREREGGRGGGMEGGREGGKKRRGKQKRKYTKSITLQNLVLTSLESAHCKHPMVGQGWATFSRLVAGPAPPDIIWSPWVGTD